MERSCLELPGLLLIMLEKCADLAFLQISLAFLFHQCSR